MALRQTPSLKGEDPFRRIIEACFRREVDSATPFPNETEDLIETGILDSMAWVSFLRAVETASGVSDLGSVLNEQPASIASVLAVLRESSKKPLASDHSQRGICRPAGTLSVLITASCSAQGSCVVPSEEVDRAFGMPIGKLRKRAGIESLAYATKRENELTLGAKTAEEVLRDASYGAQELDWIIATSETHHDYPALSAQLHSRLLARENCGALDVGGGCLGLLNALAVAQSLIASGVARTIAVVTADVHSRTLTPDCVAGEFGGLFGDGASAFLLRREEDARGGFGYRLGEFLFGCAGQYAAAIRVAGKQGGGLALELHVEATAFLSRDADPSTILSRAPQENVPNPVAEAAAPISSAAQQPTTPSIAKQTAEFARDAVGCECPAVHVRSDHRNGPCHARSNQRLRHCKRVEQSKAAPAIIQSAAVLSRQQPGVQLLR